MIRKLRQLFGWLRRRSPAVESADAEEAAVDGGLVGMRVDCGAEIVEVKNEVSEVLQCTEQATLELGANLDEIVSEARAYIGDMRARLANLDSDDGAGVAETLRDQCDSVTAFVAELRSAVQVQRDGAERMLATSRKVAEAARSVSGISTASRVLCLNTMIEAGRLGEAGQPMIVIADQMRQLSEQIAKSNHEISESIEQLMPILGDVDKSTAGIDERASRFAGDFEGQARDVTAIAERLRETTESALGSGDEKLDVIIERSGRAIESLQTQDMVSQRLNRVLQIVDPDSRSEESVPADTYLSDVMKLNDDRVMEAGEMTMF